MNEEFQKIIYLQLIKSDLSEIKRTLFLIAVLIGGLLGIFTLKPIIQLLLGI